MTAYSLAGWQDLLVATAGATASLTGLLFVAVSINVERILAYPGLPQRALETLLILLSMTVIALLGLAPTQTSDAYGFEVLAVAVVLALIVGALIRSSVHASTGEQPAYIANQVAFSVPGIVLFAVAGISMIAGAGGGLNWVLAGICAGLGSTVGNAWVLLIEILR